MKFKQWLFVGIGIVLIGVISGVIYFNYQLDHLVAQLNRPGMVYNDYPPVGSGEDANSDATGLDASGKDGVTEGSGEQGTPGQTGTAGDTPSSGVTSPRPSNQDIAEGAISKANHPVEKKDLINAGMIILRRLSSDEISYLYEVGIKDHQSREELIKARKILLKKLTPEEIEVMQSLGLKYGKRLRFLDPDVKL